MPRKKSAKPKMSVVVGGPWVNAIAGEGRRVLNKKQIKQEFEKQRIELTSSQAESISTRFHELTQLKNRDMIARDRLSKVNEELHALEEAYPSTRKNLIHPQLLQNRHYKRLDGLKHEYSTILEDITKRKKEATNAIVAIIRAKTGRNNPFHK